MYKPKWSKQYPRFIIAGLCLFFLFSLRFAKTVGHKDPILTTYQGNVMTIPYRIAIGRSLSQRESKTIEEAILSTFAYIHRVFNRWNPESELSRWNREKSAEPIEISLDLFLFLQKTQVLVQQTEGRFDPTVFPLQQAWIEAIEEGKAEPDPVLFFPFIGWNHLVLCEGKAQKKDPRLQIDLSGIAKGYCVDLLSQLLKERNIDNFYVEWGGEIRVLGQHPSGRPWRIGFSEGNGVKELVDEAMATSGDTFQRWSFQGRTVSHILDPLSGLLVAVGDPRPTAISVCAASCFAADAIATAAMTCATKQEAQTWLLCLKEQGIIRDAFVF